MKIRLGFVSNSSSTSFTLIVSDRALSDEPCSKDNMYVLILNALDVDSNSPFVSFAVEIASVLSERMSDYDYDKCQKHIQDLAKDLDIDKQYYVYRTSARNDAEPAEVYLGDAGINFKTKYIVCHWD